MPSSSMYRRPAEALLAGLEHEHHPAGQLSRRAGASWRRRPASRRGVSWPQACMVPSTSRGEVEAGVLRHRQRVHVAAQQHGRARAGRPRARRPPRLLWRPVVTASGSPSIAVRIAAWVSGSDSPTSGRRCSMRRRAMVSGWSRRRREQVASGFHDFAYPTDRPGASPRRAVPPLRGWRPATPSRAPRPAAARPPVQRRRPSAVGRCRRRRARAGTPWAQLAVPPAGSRPASGPRPAGAAGASRPAGPDRGPCRTAAAAELGRPDPHLHVVRRLDAGVARCAAGRARSSAAPRPGRPRRGGRRRRRAAARRHDPGEHLDVWCGCSAKPAPAASRSSLQAAAARSAFRRVVRGPYENECRGVEPAR